MDNATENSGEELMRRARAGRYLGVHPTTIWRWVRDGDFPEGMVVGRTRYWRRSTIDKWLERKTAGV